MLSACLVNDLFCGVHLLVFLPSYFQMDPLVASGSSHPMAVEDLAQDHWVFRVGVH